MKIKQGEIIKIKIPLIKPFVTSFGNISDREIILIKLFDETNEYGIGEAPVLSIPLYNSEMPESVIAVTKNIIFPLIKNREVETPEEITDILDFIRGNEFAKSAIVMGYYDIYGKIKSKTLMNLIGGKKNKLLMSGTISVHSSTYRVLEEAQEYISQGVQYLKLKIKPNFDLKYVRAIRQNFPSAKLTLDANASYSLTNKTKNLYKNLDKYDLYCIEQPLQFCDLVDHAKLQKNLNTRIALDESIKSVYDIEKAIELGSCKLVNIKIARVGGITNALKINEICKKNGLKTWVGGMLESPIGFYANLALSTVDNFELPIDFLGALTYIKDYSAFFIQTPFSSSNGYLYPKLDKPGLGLNLNWNSLNKFIVEKIYLN